ncbi:response regulator [Litchfieldella rifensis]|uniref:Response regulator n=1 Tax=Litchfieldella rifensis TaxID=762643 RepID=A0ABV7LRF6_9GAMM
MRVETRTDSLWRWLIWPTLWPLLLVQAGLVVLCALAWVVLWQSAMPAQQSWRALSWLILALLVGTSLIVTTFLLLLRHRLQRWEVALGVPFERLERVLRELQKELPPWLKSRRLVPARTTGEGPVTRLESLLDVLETVLNRFAERPHLMQMLERLSRPAFIARHDCLVAANSAFEQLVGRSLGEMRGLDLQYLIRRDDKGQGSSVVRLHDSKGGWQTFRLSSLVDGHGHALGILEDVNDQQQRLAQLTLSRDRAREESRLKSSYLILLQHELDVVINDLGRHLDVCQSPEQHGILRERLADLAILVANLTGPSPIDGDDAEPSQAASEVRARILIVDDGPVNTMLARRVLEAEGLGVDTAQSGEQALELAAREHYDLVFMDIYMPDLDGVETSRRWRHQEEQGGGAIPSVLVALTANASTVDRERFFSAGMDDFLPKPYRPQALLDMVGRWLPDALEDRQQ